MMRLQSWIAGVCAACALAVAAPVAQADDPDFLSFGAGWFDFNRQKDPGAEFRLEYRSDYKLWVFKPFAAVGVATTNHNFIGAGILMDIYFGRRFVVTPSFAPHYYFGNDDDGLNMGHEIEFRSQIEFAYRFDDRSRLGLAVSHYSNAGLGDKNPGTETLSLYYSLPISTLTGMFGE